MNNKQRFASLPPQRQQMQSNYYQNIYEAPQRQQQEFQQRLTQQQAEIRYYIYQHLQFLTNLLYSMEEIQNYFEDDPNHPMVTIGLNKIILQLNLINTTNVDLQERCRSSQEVQELQECKENAKRIIKEATKNLKPQLREFVEQYINNSLQKNVTIKQLNPKTSTQQYQFNQNVVQDIFNAMNKTDQEVGRLSQTKNYEIPHSSSVIEIAKQFQQRTNSKLSVNFQKRGSPMKSQKKPQYDSNINLRQQDLLKSCLQPSAPSAKRSELIQSIFFNQQTPAQQQSSQIVQGFKSYQQNLDQFKMSQPYKNQYRNYK